MHIAKPIVMNVFPFVHDRAVEIRLSVRHVGARGIESDGIERCEHSDVGDDRRIVFGMTVTARGNVDDERYVKLRPAFYDGGCVFGHLFAQYLIRIFPDGMRRIFRTGADASPAADADFFIDARFPFAVFAFNKFDRVLSAFTRACTAADAQLFIDFRFSVVVLFHLSRSARTSHADIFDRSSEARTFMQFKMCQRNEHIGVHHRVPDLRLFYVFAFGKIDISLVRPLQSVADDYVTAAHKRVETVHMDGFDPLVCGCHVIIGDGLKGTDETYVDFPEGEYIKQAKIGHAVMDADVFISLTHFKLHESTGFGGTIKNIGMGCASRAGKMEQHNDGKPEVDEELCVGCGACARECGQDAIEFIKSEDGKRKARIDEEICVGCGRCIGACPKDATHPVGKNTNEILCKKMAEYAAAVVKGRPQFHISLIVDVSPCCDCHAENDAPIIPDVGMFASFDAVALDAACADMTNRQPYLHGTIMDEREHVHNDWFCDVHPTTNWKVQLEHAEKVGMGVRDYELIKL